MSAAKDNAPSRIISASLPKRDELCCIIARTNREEARNSAEGSTHNLRILVCRSLIDKIPDIIVSPAAESDVDIYIVATNEFYKTGALQSELIRKKLKYSSRKLVTSGVYEACLRYTIIFGLAPNWNTVAGYLLQGINFIQSTEIITAVRMGLSVSDEGLRLELRANRVRIPFMTLEDLHLPEATLHEFMQDPKGSIDFRPFGFPRVHVLPSLKKGTVLSVSKEMPRTSLLKTYDSLRTYWKNMYGYHLPSDDDGIIYYQIKFFNKLFTYPSICLRSGPLAFVHAGDHRATTDHFCESLRKKVPTVCGRPVQLYDFQENVRKRKLGIENIPPGCTVTSASKMLSEALTPQNNSGEKLAISGTRTCNLLRRRFRSSDGKPEIDDK